MRPAQLRASAASSLVNLSKGTPSTRASG
ncbi:MAG: hypothetical protein JCHSAcid_15220 [uncultured Acidilobus sp. JCHS]|jgi:hypothetical protein|nr:MAG: hypothetical protein JCHSAcid_15220 [uncultured Acidilobus sp. JCHS]